MHDGVFTEEVPLLNSDPCKLRISAMNWLAEGTHPNGGNMGPRLIIDIVRIDSKYDVHLVSELVLENGTLYGARHPWLDDMGMVRFTQTSRTLSYDGGEQYEYTLRPNKGCSEIFVYILLNSVKGGNIAVICDFDRATLYIFQDSKRS